MAGPGVRPLPWLLASIFCAALIVALAGHRLFRAQRADILEQRAVELAAIADLKLQELSRWRNERLNDARVVADNPFLADALTRLGPGSAEAETRGRLAALLAALQRHYRYQGAAIVDQSGAAVATSGIDADELQGHLRATMTEWAPLVETVFTDLHAVTEEAEPHLGIFQPLAGRYLLYLLVDPSIDLYPIIRHWPTPSPSGEVLLVRREGDDVVFLNELRHRGGTALRLRMPLARTSLPAARAASGFVGVVEGVDYRGIEVLAVTRRIPETSWFMVAKIDRAEVLGPIQQRGRVLGLLGVLLWLLATAALLLLRHQQRLVHVRREYAASERHREELGRATDLLRAEEEQRSRQVERLESIVALSERTGLSVSALLNEVLEQALALTGSRYGYLYRYDEGQSRFTLNSWSGMVLPECSVTEPQTVYELEKTGIWGEVVRQRREILLNDFAAEHPLKNGVPAGHVPLRNFLTIPVFAGAEIVAALGVANKDGDYTPADVAQLKLLMSGAWRIVERYGAVDDLKRTVAELQRSNEDLAQFAYIASHDLQEPLRSISSFLQLIERRYRERLDDEGREYIAFAVAGANHLQTMIEGLLAYSKIGRVTPVQTAVDLGRALETASAHLAVALQESGAVVTSDPLPAVTADENQIVQLFQNLLANAIKFRGESSPRIHVSCETRAEESILHVRDNGIGIAAEHQKRIFEIFRRLHGQDVPGAGIGLALCRRIVERGGGSIWVESEPGRGATFSFTLTRDKGDLA